jgi:hypothetical protein
MVVPRTSIIRVAATISFGALTQTANYLTTFLKGKRVHMFRTWFKPGKDDKMTMGGKGKASWTTQTQLKW